MLAEFRKTFRIRFDRDFGDQKFVISFRIGLGQDFAVLN